MRGRTNRRETAREVTAAGRRLLLTAALFAVGTIVTWLSVTHLAYATGVAGRSGHLKVETCTWSEAGGHRYPHCHGVFRSDDGTVVDPGATIDSDLPVGDTVALRRTSSDGYEQTGAGAAFGWLAVSLLGLVVLVLGAATVRGPAGSRGSPRVLLILLGVLVAAMLTSAFIGGVVGVVGALRGRG
ncbi:hypothetical protein [Streptomyces sp. NPDC005281]|uniref:hypothetical protein n=1 Tax=Streptomyces sp. NPDC005281 TaxID=3155712 RepID=UPI0033B013D9